MAGLKVSVASGKGGTGKTTVAVGLFNAIQQRGKYSPLLVDCDVEEPNDKIFLSMAKINKSLAVTKKIAKIDITKCTYCRKCLEYCEFNAIVIIPPVEFAEVNSDLCHSCGACLFACPDDAISEIDEAIGEVSFFTQEERTVLLEGRLKIGSSMQTMMIRDLKRHIPEDHEIVILDAPPGTSCPVVETISDTDFIILVTEPTPFGLHDLKLMLELVNEIKIPHAVVINKAGIGDDKVKKLLKERNIPLLAEIPYSKDFAAQYANGKISQSDPNEIYLQFDSLADLITKKCQP